MGSRANIDTFSSFVLELHARGATHDPVALFQWSMDAIAQIVGADCSWGGWSDLRRGDIDLRATLSYNLPDDFATFWSDIKQDDLLARDVLATGSSFAHYDRYGSRQTEGMVALSERYHLDKMSVVVGDQQDRPAALFMSSYRGGRRARAMDDNEIGMVRGALDHLRYLVETSCLDRIPGVVKFLVNTDGRLLAASPDALRFVRDRWPGWSGQYLPTDINAPSSLAARRRLTDLNVKMERRELANRTGQPLFGITLRPTNPCDGLTQRERQIADEIAAGFTHKEIARRLGLSPATVRNHTQAILSKLGIHSRAMLSKMIPSSLPV